MGPACSNQKAVGTRLVRVEAKVHDNEVPSHQSVKGDEVAPNKPLMTQQNGWISEEKEANPATTEDEVQPFNQLDLNLDNERPSIFHKKSRTPQQSVNKTSEVSSSPMKPTINNWAGKTHSSSATPGRGSSGNIRSSVQVLERDDVFAFEEKPLTPITPGVRPKVNDTNFVAFGAGCYWGTEQYFRRKFGPHIVKGAVGFMGPQNAKPDPTYEEVCNGGTGHIEVFDLEFKGGMKVFEQMCRYFFQIHDPTTLNRQGNDRGTQYASVIYVEDSEFFELAYSIKDEVQRLVNSKQIKCYESVRVSTVVRLRTTFFRAKEDHQLYLERHPDGYCNHAERFHEWPKIEAS